MTTALKIDHLSYAYGKKAALDGVGFAVEAGQCCILLGPNGAGKSTLFASSPTSTTAATAASPSPVLM